MNNGRCEFLPKSRPGSSLTDTNEGTKSFSAPIMRAHNVKRVAIGPCFTLSEQDINGIFIFIGPRSPRFITKVANKGEYIKVCQPRVTTMICRMLKQAIIIQCGVSFLQERTPLEETVGTTRLVIATVASKGGTGS